MSFQEQRSPSSDRCSSTWCQNYKLQCVSSMHHVSPTGVKYLTTPPPPPFWHAELKRDTMQCHLSSCRLHSCAVGFFGIESSLAPFNHRYLPSRLLQMACSVLQPGRGLVLCSELISPGWQGGGSTPAATLQCTPSHGKFRQGLPMGMHLTCTMTQWTKLYMQ